MLLTLLSLLTPQREAIYESKMTFTCNFNIMKSKKYIIILAIIVFAIQWQNYQQCDSKRFVRKV